LPLKVRYFTGYESNATGTLHTILIIYKFTQKSPQLQPQKPHSLSPTPKSPSSTEKRLKHLKHLKHPKHPKHPKHQAQASEMPYHAKHHASE